MTETTMVFHPRPGAGPEKPWTFPAPERGKLANGLSVLRVHRPGQRVVAVELLLDAPLDAEPEGIDGVATIMSRAFSEGTDTMDAETFAAELERCGATMDAGADHAGVQIALDVPASRLERALGLMADAVRAPAFPADEVDRLVRQRLDEIVHELASPARRAAIALYGELFDSAARISRPRAGTSESVARVDRASVVDFFTAHVRPATSTVVVVGDLDGVDLDGILERTLGRWTGSDAPPTEVVPAVADDTARVVIVNRPGSVQTQVLAGRLGPDRHAAVWPALSIGTYCLGGTLTSRLDRVLREEKGYTYGIRALNQSLRSGALLAITGSVDTESTGPAMSDLVQVLTTLAAEGLEDDERDAAVQNLVGVAPLKYQTSRAVADSLADVVAQRLPDDYLPGLYARLGAVATGDASAAAVAGFDPAHLVIVLVGDAGRIREPLEQLGLGPVTVVE
ncbi:M16 family metallopeptidase [Yinghuangia soli]|uniref:Insulinase family protein n=1 Tax=Yinghuangia soli TaxID=2908204 RepID=A0AA41TX19_9ACTN|nr:pitrilysin family protein [Yinghuangia soli]MCF2526393.1 insulinase family protein [Yinghuangia soli]